MNNWCKTNQALILWKLKNNQFRAKNQEYAIKTCLKVSRQMELAF